MPLTETVGFNRASNETETEEVTIDLIFAITKITDGGGGEINITIETEHYLEVGNKVIVAGTTNYNGEHIITGLSVTNPMSSFSITEAYIADESGTVTLINETIAMNV